MATDNSTESKHRDPREPDDGTAALWRRLNDNMIRVDTLIEFLASANIGALEARANGIVESYAEVMGEHANEAQESISQLRDRYGRTYDDFLQDPKQGGAS